MTDWKPDLKKLFDDVETKKKLGAEKKEANDRECQAFMKDVVGPAFEELKAELVKYGRQVVVNVGWQAVGITVMHDGKQELDLSICCRGLYPYPEERFIDREGRHFKSEGSLRSGAQDFTVRDFKKDEILQYSL
jgi:hypothetical protein